MWRLLRFLLIGDTHLHRWKFTHADRLSVRGYGNLAVVKYVKVCEVCGAHRSGKIQDCWADSAGELIL